MPEYSWNQWIFIGAVTERFELGWWWGWVWWEGHLGRWGQIHWATPLCTALLWVIHQLRFWLTSIWFLSHGQTNRRALSAVSGDRLQCVGLLAEPGGSSGHYTGVHDVCIHTVAQDQPLEIKCMFFITDSLVHASCSFIKFLFCYTMSMSRLSL